MSNEKNIVATGFENCVVTNWKGWDGGDLYFYFYECELRPEILEFMHKMYPEFNQLVKTCAIDVEINFETMNWSIFLINQGELKAKFVKSFNLMLTPMLTESARQHELSE